MKRIWIFVCIVVLLGAVMPLTACTTESGAGNAADFYKGKQLTIIVTSSAGGGTDLNARILASFLGNQMGCGVVVKNQPAGNGNVARTELATTAKADGLTIMTDPCLGMWIPWAFGEAGTEGFDITQYQYLAGINYGQPVMITSASSPYNTVEALQKATEPVRFAGAKLGSFPIANFIALELLNINAKVVMGYPGMAACILAMEQGEADGTATGIEEGDRYQKAGQANNLLAITAKRVADYPDVPALGEFATIPESMLAVLNAFEKEGGVFVAPPDTPGDRVKFLRDSFNAVFADEGFLKSFKTAGRVWLGSWTGEVLQAESVSFAKNKDAFVGMVGELVDKYVQE